MSNGYLISVAAAAASIFRARAEKRRAAAAAAKRTPPSPAEVKRMNRAQLERLNAENLEAARVVFPNDHGNYCGKRFGRKAPRPLTAGERFARLVAMHLERHRTYRFLAAA